jgi:signal transduction histidine kinase
MAQRTPEGPRARIRLARLRFTPDLEPAFRAYHFERSLLFMRFAIVLEVVLYASFGVLDLLIVPDVAGWIWLIRSGVVCVSLAVLGFTYTRSFEPVAQPTLAVVAAIAGLGIVAMVAIADASASALYYAGLLLVIPWAYSVLRLRFRYATGVAPVIIVGFEAVAIWVKHMPVDLLVNANFFFVSSVIIGMVAGYTIERSMRTEFVQRRLIEAQRSELAERNVRLDSALQESLEELKASRARIVAAGDRERRRIERDIHDGAQQQLIALAVKLNLAGSVVRRDAEKTEELLAQLEAEAQDALENLRDLARGIYPPLLSDRGLAVALEAQARKATFPVRVEADGIGRYAPEVEAAAYFCCLEALQNVGKYARATSVCLELACASGELTFEVVDDGIGFDLETASLGSGLQNMRDRLAAIGGSLTIEAHAGRGTTVRGRIPVPQ